MSNRRESPEREVLTRMRRLETRLTNFIRYFGVDPTADFDEETSRVVTTDGVAMYCATPRATVGDLMFIAHKHKLQGDAPVYVAGQFIGHIRTVKELSGERHARD